MTNKITSIDLRINKITILILMYWFAELKNVNVDTA